jgi:hypothetical protein
MLELTPSKLWPRALAQLFESGEVLGVIPPQMQGNTRSCPRQGVNVD